MQRRAGMNPLIELLLQRGFRLRQNSALGGLLACEFRKRREFIIQIRSGNPVPESVFECEHFDLFLFEAENRRVRQLNHDLTRLHVDGDVVLQIEAGFGHEGGVQFHPLGAARPGVE